ncbi:uncharacterized protein LOC117240075 [Bombus vosnesenskii]|uniref:Uncharacterized protein LOC117240075 n=1 Tax=Bombus vosnesenskii TaxID=207650 RepID=A0A6J3L926_9HYME|nr:uncharacterized protein LOC117240075 [Bombus vosnesenskii]
MLTLLNKEAPDMVLISETKLNKRHKLNKPENYYIIAGDLNAKHTSWKNEINNTRGNFIRNWLDNKSIHYKTNLYSSELPSYPKGGSYLDICLADARLKFQNLRPNNTVKTLAYDSDHNALVFQINKNTSDFLTLETQTETPRYNYKKTDWKKFQNTLEQNCDLKIYNNVNLTNRQIDSFLDEIEKHTQIALQKSVPIIKQKNSCEPCINNKIKDLQRDKSYILSKINNIKLNYSYDKREELEFLKFLLHRIKTQLKQEFATSINHYWTNKIKNISKNDSANMFPQINQIFRPKERGPTPPLKLPPENAPLIQEAGITIHNTIKDTEGNFIIPKTIEKLDIIGTHFSKIHTQNEHMGREQLNRIIIAETNKLKNEMEQDKMLNKTVCTFSNENTADNPKQPDPEINYFTNYNQLNTILSKLNNKKSSGFDGIPNTLLKRLPNKIKWYYTVLFNNALNNTYFPRKWKKAKLIAITKKNKDGSSPANLRPINLEKAFDTVWIPGLIYKLNKKKFPKHLTKMVWDMITNRTFVMTEGSHSSSKEFSIKNGLQQGTVNSPLLFSIYNSDLLNLFDLNTSTHKRSIAFADDLIIYVTGRKTKTIKTELQELFEKINDYYHAWKLKINISKCETILFRPKSSKIGPTEREHCKKFQIREKTDKGALIPHKNCVKYLGVNIDYKLNYKQHTEIQLTKANKAFWKMKNLFHSKHLDRKVKILCYQALIRPIITYGCPICPRPPHRLPHPKANTKPLRASGKDKRK